MEPKQKAQSLIDKYISSGCLFANAKTCALICAEEILNDLNESLDVSQELHLHTSGLISGSIYVWNQVKQELEKL